MGVLLLVRHGQASWGAEDYDVLSDVGWEQSRALGASLAERSLVPALVVRGSMRRHRETAEGAGFGDAEVDTGWDEFDSIDVFSRAGDPPAEASRAEFQAWFEAAMERWTGGEHDDYAESFLAFSERVGAALRRTAEAVGDGTALVVTSGGPISWCLASLLGAHLPYAEQVTLSRSFNLVCANTGVSKVVTGRRGLTAVQFNEHTHLESRPELLTYR